MKNNTPISAAKQRLRIPALWVHLGFSGEPKTSCRCPWRDDHKPSFSVSHQPPLMQGCQNRRQLRALVEQMCIGCFSGMATERLFDSSAPDFHGEGDESNAWNLLRDNSVTPRGCRFVGDDVYVGYLQRLRVKAERFVQRQRLAVDALAEALLAKETMIGAEAMAIVRPLLR